VHKYQISGVPLGHQACILGAPLGHEVLHSRGILRSSRPIFLVYQAGEKQDSHTPEVKWSTMGLWGSTRVQGKYKISAGEVQ